MRVLVTGGSGFIGSALCRYLVQAGDEVVNLDKLTYAATPGSTAELKDSQCYSFVRADIVDEAAVHSILESFRPEAIMHLAAESHVDRSITGPSAFVQTNVVGTFSMLQCALEYWLSLSPALKDRFRFLHVSTDEVYGSLGPTGLFSETSPYDPRSPYSASKAAADHLASAWFHTFKLPVLKTNCSNNYGPFHFPEKLIPLTIISALERRPVPIYGDGSNVRDWLYVEDHATALRLILERGQPGRTYNVGGRNERTNLEVVETICTLLDEMTGDSGPPRRSLITSVEDRPGHDARYAIDATRLETELGWRAQHAFEAGLRKTVRWFVSNEAWWRPLWEQHRGQRLGLRRAGVASRTGSL